MFVVTWTIFKINNICTTTFRGNCLFISNKKVCLIVVLYHFYHRHVGVRVWDRGGREWKWGYEIRFSVWNNTLWVQENVRPVLVEGTDQGRWDIRTEWFWASLWVVKGRKRVRIRKLRFVLTIKPTSIPTYRPLHLSIPTFLFNVGFIFSKLGSRCFKHNENN